VQNILPALAAELGGVGYEVLYRVLFYLYSSILHCGQLQQNLIKHPFDILSQVIYFHIFHVF